MDADLLRHALLPAAMLEFQHGGLIPGEQLRQAAQAAELAVHQQRRRELLPGGVVRFALVIREREDRDQRHLRLAAGRGQFTPARERQVRLPAGGQARVVLRPQRRAGVGVQRPPGRGLVAGRGGLGRLGRGRHRPRIGTRRGGQAHRGGERQGADHGHQGRHQHGGRRPGGARQGRRDRHSVPQLDETDIQQSCLTLIAHQHALADAGVLVVLGRRQRLPFGAARQPDAFVVEGDAARVAGRDQGDGTAAVGELQVRRHPDQ
ncbi:conserved hypothetical protein, partial [Ricinus communis]